VCGAHLDVGAGALRGLDKAVDDVGGFVSQRAAADRRKCNRRDAVSVGHLQARAEQRAQLLDTAPVIA